MKRSNGFSEFMVYTLVSIASAALSFITMIALTRLTSEAFFGKINKYLNAANVVMSLVCLGLDSAYIRFYYEPPKHNNSKNLAWKCMFPSFVFLVIVSIVLLILSNSDLFVFLLGSKGLLFVGAFVIVVLAQYLIRYMTIFFRMSSKVISFAIVSMVLVICTKTIFIPIIFLTEDFKDNIVIASLLLGLFGLVYFIFHIKDILEIKKSEKGDYNQVYKFALLSSPVFVITYLNSYIPQVVISRDLGDDILGIYTAALLFCSAIQVLSTGFTTFWSPYMYKNYKTSNQTIKNIHDLVLVGCVFVLALILIFCDYIYLFIGENFRKNQNLLGMLLIYPIILIVVETTAYGINIEKKNEISLVIYFVSTLINAIMCIVLTPSIGLLGVAISSMFSAVVQLILMTYFGQKYYCSVNNLFRSIINFGLLLISAILFYFLYDNYILLFNIIEIILLITCIIININVVKFMYKYIRRSLKRGKNVKQ